MTNVHLRLRYAVRESPYYWIVVSLFRIYSLESTVGSKIEFSIVNSFTVLR